MAEEDQVAPLAGIRVVEFSHMIFGPSCGMILAELGADVIKVEPPGTGDRTRRLTGAGAGFFPMFNRDKRSIALDVKNPEGLALARRLIDSADVMIENFRPGAMDKLGLGAEAVRETNPTLIYCSAKGFLPGPYDHRAALDEVVQMASGLAYMTGPPGRPLRAGSSVVDIMGGAFAVIGILSALRERDSTGEGCMVTSALYENAVFLCGQHMMQHQVSGIPAPPMPGRANAWAVYDVFDCLNDEQVFVGAVTNTQWREFCVEFGLDDLLEDPELQENSDRCDRRDQFIPRIREIFATMTKPALMDRCEALGLPYAPIGRPDELGDDPHLNASGGLVDVTLADGKTVKAPALPLDFDNKRPAPSRSLPRLGEHSRSVAEELGLSAGEIERLENEGVLENG